MKSEVRWFCAAALCAVLALAGCATTKGAGIESSFPYAGSYKVTQIVVSGTDGNSGDKGKTGEVMMFVVEDDRTLSGAFEESGWTPFLGIVEADGSFSAEFYKIGGKLSGKIAEDGSLAGSYDLGKYGTGDLIGSKKGE